MSLLTNEQLAELIGIASNQSTSRDLYEEFHEWNEKQIPSTQFEPDWDNAPSNAKSVFLHAVWFDNEINQVERTVISGWGRPVTPHPHAEMIMKYAEVAARRIDPWVEFEIFIYSRDEWFKCTEHLKFTTSCKYRHIGDKNE